MKSINRRKSDPQLSHKRHLSKNVNKNSYLKSQQITLNSHLPKYKKQVQNLKKAVILKKQNNLPSKSCACNNSLQLQKLPKIQIKQKKHNYQWIKKSFSNRLKSIESLSCQNCLQDHTEISCKKKINIINSLSIFNLQLKHSQTLKHQKNQKLDILDYRDILDQSLKKNQKQSENQMKYFYRAVKKLSHT